MGNFQDQIFEQIIAQFPRKTDAVEELAQYFSVGKDAIYRRMRGDTILSPEELKALAKKYSFSLDALAFQHPDLVFFSFNSFTRRVESFEDYLLEIYKNIETARLLPGIEIYYSSAEIPIFYYCYFPELISFKLYVWGRTVWNLKYLDAQPFHFDMMGAKTQNLTSELLQKYNYLPSTEFWSSSIMNNTLSQIEWLVTSGDFANPEEALALCDVLIELNHHMRNMTKARKKFGMKVHPEEAKTPFSLYHNEMIFTTNMIYVKSDVAKIVFSTFKSPNFLRSVDRRLCNHIDDWFQNIKRKSTQLTGGQEKQQNWFFNTMEKKILSTRKRIELLLG